MIQTILLLFMSSQTWSASSLECSTTTTMEGVKRCIEELGKTVGNTGKFPMKCASIPDKEKKFVFQTLAEPFYDDGAVCTNFIKGNSKSGGYGPWGNTIIEYLKEEGSDSIFMSSDLPGMSTGVAACPNWKRMTVDEKRHFWVWVMAAISKVESTCQPHARNGGGTNGVAVGLVQLDERPSQRKWRGDNCKAKSVKAPEDNLRCGLDILSELLKGQNGEYKGSGELWGRKSGSYWQHLRQSSGGEISDLIKLNPYCKK